VPNAGLGPSEQSMNLSTMQNALFLDLALWLTQLQWEIMDSKNHGF